MPPSSKLTETMSTSKYSTVSSSINKRMTPSSVTPSAAKKVTIGFLCFLFRLVFRFFSCFIICFPPPSCIHVPLCSQGVFHKNVAHTISKSYKSIIPRFGKKINFCRAVFAESQKFFDSRSAESGFRHNNAPRKPPVSAALGELMFEAMRVTLCAYDAKQKTRLRIGQRQRQTV